MLRTSQYLIISTLLAGITACGGSSESTTDEATETNSDTVITDETGSDGVDSGESGTDESNSGDSDSSGSDSSGSDSSNTDSGESGSGGSSSGESDANESGSNGSDSGESTTGDSDSDSSGSDESNSDETGSNESGSDEEDAEESESEESEPEESTSDETEVGNFTIVDTQQSQCFNSTSGSTVSCQGSGFDADYSGNQPSYTVSDTGLSVLDNVTKLVWTQSSDLDGNGDVNYNDKRFQEEAVTYCNNLSLDGRSDWRLPSIKEAYSLILFSGKDPSSYTGSDSSTLTPFIDSAFDWAFGDISTTEGIEAGDRIIDAQYASTSLYVSTTMQNDDTMFGVNYVDGRIKGYPYKRKEFYVRCVAGNESYGINAFEDNADETVSDNATGLMWQQNDSASTGWENAIDQCETSTTANHSDWRLPNAKELQSILDYSKSPDTDNDAAIDDVFNSTSFLNEESLTDWGFYWSSTTHMDNEGDGSNAVYVSFGRALGYMNNQMLDVHGAGAQRSNDKVDVSTEPGAQSASINGTFYYKGPQGDILRLNNKVRCVRDI